MWMQTPSWLVQREICVATINTDSIIIWMKVNADAVAKSGHNMLAVMPWRLTDAATDCRTCLNANALYMRTDTGAYAHQSHTLIRCCCCMKKKCVGSSLAVLLVVLLIRHARITNGVKCLLWVYEWKFSAWKIGAHRQFEKHNYSRAAWPIRFVYINVSFPNCLWFFDPPFSIKCVKCKL